ncbi:MAG TPA: DNA/RNA non-specific endonuclease, partial [Vicinamibacterales bacterium]|nr:DNA/RNA non-specific endonuclease [Vicinamibacterales bacterium]
VRPDPQVPPEWYRVQSFDFSGSGFDRGHMTPNADRDKETSIPINQATFLMSNMVAQAPANNQGPWANLEAYLRTLTDPTNTSEPGNNELYIVSGPAGAGGSGSNVDQNGQPFVTTTVANGHVAVPAWTWKVALVLPKDGADDLSRVTCSTRTIAVIMPNTQAINSDWKTYLATVDAVEQLTGYDFFSNLPTPYQQCIEAGINGINPPLVKGDQTITFPHPSDSVYGDQPFTVSAAGGASGSPVTFNASGACASGGPYGATITILRSGSCTITASQAGTDIYNAAADVSRTFNVARAALSVSADDATREFGAPNPAFTGTLTGVVNGDGITASYVTAATQSSPVGGYAIVPVLSDPKGRLANYAVSSHNALLAIVDTTLPAIGAVSASPDVIWPPNKQMIPVSVAVAVSDAADAAPVCSVTGISSNEPQIGDSAVIGRLTVSLRADRNGNGNGRIYTIGVRCVDASGNASTATTIVTVPHDQRR